MKIKLLSVFCSLLFAFYGFEASAQSKDPTRIYKVAILPFVIHSQENLDYLREGINDILTSRLTAEGRIAVIERGAVERALWELRPMRLDEAVARQLGLRTGADYVVLGSLTKIGNYISLDARLIPITDDKPPLAAYTQHKGIDDVMVKIGDFAQDIGFRITGRRTTTARLSDTRQPAFLQPGREAGRIGPEGPAYKKSQTFNFEIKGLDIGDVDGDKKNEVVVMDHHNLYVFKYDGDKLSLFRKIEVGYQHNFLTLDVADVNRNGIAEIIVTSVVEDNLESFILEYEQNEFRVIVRKSNWFYRVLYHPKEGAILTGQRMGADGLPSGPVFRFIWKKNTYEKGPKIVFPGAKQIYGLALADIRGDGKLDTILLDEFERLKISSSDGKTFWYSKDRFGGTANYYDTTKKKADAFRGQDAPPWRVFLPGRIIIKDIDGDGVNDIIINKNNATLGILERSKTFDSGVIYSLTWEGEEMVTSWKTTEISGYISDFQVKDADNDGAEDLVVAVVKSHRSGGFGGQGESHVLFFKLY